MIHVIHEIRRVYRGYDDNMLSNSPSATVAGT